MKKDAKWRDFTVVCIASGPSLTPEDIESVRQWRAGRAGRAVVTTNTTVFSVPWADVLVAWDGKWWKTYIARVNEEFKGERWTGSHSNEKYQAQRFTGPFRAHGNSGAAAVSLALWRGAGRVLMLGYDCQKTDGKTHHHGSHPEGMSDAATIEKWPDRFKALAQRSGGKVLNCSRVTALTCFPMARLEDELDESIAKTSPPRAPETQQTETLGARLVG